MKRVSNSGCGKYVSQRIPFRGSNLFAEQQDKLYIVYSYGKHFPMYIYDEDVGQWFGNSNKYSQSTSRQQSQAYPHGVTAIHYMPTDQMVKLSYMGYKEFVQRRMGVEHVQQQAA